MIVINHRAFRKGGVEQGYLLYRNCWVHFEGEHLMATLCATAVAVFVVPKMDELRSSLAWMPRDGSEH